MRLTERIFDSDQDPQSTLGTIVTRRIIIDPVVNVEESSSFGQQQLEILKKTFHMDTSTPFYKT